MTDAATRAAALLKDHRASIDRLDAILIYTLGERFKHTQAVGKLKAEQIRNTGAVVVATPCHNCVDQLLQINADNKLNVRIKTMAEIVADAIVLQNEDKTKENQLI